MSSREALGGGRSAPHRPRLDLVLTIFAVSSVFLLLSFEAFHKIWAADFWSQYRTGQYVLRSGPPHQDVFSFTIPGAPWIELRWLYCAALAVIVPVTGFSGLIVLTWMVMLASFGIVTLLAVDRRTAVPACGVLTVALLASYQRFFIRPELVTYLLLASFLGVLDRYRSRDSRLIYSLPFLQVLWVNSHPFFGLGPLLVGLMLLVTTLKEGTEGLLPAVGMKRVIRPPVRKVRILAVVLVATVLACLLNPYGLKAFDLSLQLVRVAHGTVFKESIIELMTPFELNPRPLAVTYYEGLIVLCFLSALLNIRNLDGFWSVLVLSQLYLSFTAVRNLPLFAFSAIPFIVFNLRNASLAGHPLVSPWLPALNRLLALLVIAVCAGYSWDLATDRFSARQGLTDEFGGGLARHRYPDGAVHFLDEVGLSGPLFNTLVEGSYLIARDRKVFVDGRLEVYGEEFFSRFLRMQQDEGLWRQEVARFGLRVALVDLQSPLARNLLSSREWNLLYFDEVAAVFERSDSPSPRSAIRTLDDFQAAIARLRERLPVPSSSRGWFDRVALPVPYLRVSSFLRAAGQTDAAASFAREALTAYSDAPGAHALLAQALENQRDFAGAAREYQAALDLDPASYVVRRRLGMCLYLTGRMEEAPGALEASQEGSSVDPLVWAVLSRIHSLAGRTTEAVSTAKRAVVLAPADPNLRKNLGRMYAASGDSRRTVATLERALRLDPGDSTVYRDLALIRLGAGQKAEALSTVEKGLAVRPDDPELRKLLSDLRRS